MAEIIIYTSDTCPYCTNAKSLLERKGRSDYKEINAKESPEIMQEMIEKSGGRRTVPQIFIGDFHVGGFDDLAELDNKGELDKLLA